MRFLVVPVLALAVGALGTSLAHADPLLDKRVRYIHDESLAHGSAAEVPARSSPKVLTMRLSRPLDTPPATTLLLDTRTSEPEDQLSVLRRVVVDQLTAVDRPDMKLQTLPQIIRSADGRLLGVGLKLRF